MVSCKQTNIARYPDVKFRYIVVGNEVSPSSEYSPLILPAMRHIYKALCSIGLEKQIAVSTSIKLDLIEKSYPPKDGVFRANVTWYIKPIVEFLRDTNAPLLTNIYPYFAYMENMKDIDLGYALLEPGCGIDIDGVHYDNIFYAMIDALDAAMEKILSKPLSSSSSPISAEMANMPPPPPVTVSESGWASEMRPDRIGEGEVSTIKNAKTFNNNLMRVVKKGTPKRPGIPIEAYIFAMFDEDLKPGPEYEKHFGIFYPNQQPKYKLTFY